LIDGNHRSKVSFALKNYENYVIKNKFFYDSFFNFKFLNLSLDYLNSLTDVRFKKAFSYFEVNNIFIELIFYMLLPKLEYFFKKLFRKSASYTTFIPLCDKRYGAPTRAKFYSLTKKYTSNLFNSASSDKGISHLYFEQLVPAMKIDRYFNYCNNLKVIVVDRDPRDIYLLNQIYWKGASFICDTSDVHQYIDWYKSMRFNLEKDYNNTNVLKVRFEDLVYNYDDTLSKILNFSGISARDHIRKKMFFDPEKSKLNTQLWKKHNLFSFEVSEIHSRLSEFCFEFDEIKN